MEEGAPPGLPKEEIGIIRRSAHQGLFNANSLIDCPNARSSGVHAVPAAFSPLQQSRWRQYYPITPSLSVSFLLLLLLLLLLLNIVTMFDLAPDDYTVVPLTLLDATQSK